MMKELIRFGKIRDDHAVPCSLKLTNGVLSSFQQGIVFHPCRSIQDRLSYQRRHKQILQAVYWIDKNARFKDALKGCKGRFKSQAGQALRRRTIMDRR